MIASFFVYQAAQRNNKIPRKTPELLMAEPARNIYAGTCYPISFI